MSKDTFAFSSASLRSFRLEQELQDWEDARRTLAQRRALTRTPLAPVPRPPRQQHSLRATSHTLGPYRCRDPAVLNTFLSGDMTRVYAVLKDPTMVNALMETVQEEMTWAPEMGMWTLTSKVKQTSALRLAASRGHSACVEELLFRGAAVNANPGGRSALHDACAGGHDSCVQLLLSHGADGNLLTADGSSALHLCTSAQTFSCAQLLLEVGGASVNACSGEAKLTPLHVAARRGLEEHVELLLRHGADVAACSREGETPLNAACAAAERPSEAGRFLRVVQSLLRAGANPRTAGRKRHTPLHNACSNCSPRIVDLLLQHGAQANAENCAGYTPMDCLVQVVEDFPDQGPEAVARALLNHGIQPPLPKMLKLCCLSPSTLEVMLNYYVTVPSCDEWIDSVPLELWESLPVPPHLYCNSQLVIPISKEHRPFFESVLRMVGQPRSLQHLCRCSLRHHLGALYQMAISKLDMPAFVRDYLLLRTDGQLR